MQPLVVVENDYFVSLTNHTNQCVKARSQNPFRCSILKHAPMQRLTMKKVLLQKIGTISLAAYS